MVPWRTIFFVINFGVTMVVVLPSLAIIVDYLVVGVPSFAFFGAVIFIWPALAIGVGEWLLYVRNVRSLERPLGVVCGLVGVMAIYGFVMNAADAAVKGDSLDIGFWLVSGGKFFGIAAYGLWCCWLRVNSRPGPRRSPAARR
jgi:hypothetical protein